MARFNLNIIIIVLIIFVIGYTILTAEDYQNQCNNHWAEQWNDLCYRYGCQGTPKTFNTSYNYFHLVTGE